MNDIRQDQTARKALLELADRVERLVAAERNVDAAIWEAIGLAPEYQNDKSNYGRWHYRGRGHYHFSDDSAWGRNLHAPHYTSSIDAAMTLVPEPYIINMLSDFAFDGVTGVRLVSPDLPDALSFGTIDIPKALTAAALRARAELVA